MNILILSQNEQHVYIVVGFSLDALVGHVRSIFGEESNPVAILAVAGAVVLLLVIAIIVILVGYISCQTYLFLLDFFNPTEN